jgi:hypothetical protein
MADLPTYPQSLAPVLEKGGDFTHNEDSTSVQLRGVISRTAPVRWPQGRGGDFTQSV